MTERMVESHLSIAPRVRRDFFGERNEDQLLSPLEIRIHEAVQFTGERRERRIGAHIENSNLTTSVWLTFGTVDKFLFLVKVAISGCI
jgi:hypothetical protein